MSVAGVFDFLKIASLALIFMAPLVVGVGAKAVTQGYLEQQLGTGWGDTVSSWIGAGAAGAAAAVELTQPEVVGLVGTFSVMLAWVIALAGCFILVMLLAFFGHTELLSPSVFPFIAFMVIASLIPLVDGAPTLSGSIWGITRAARKRERKALREWQERKKAYEASIAGAMEQNRVLAAMQMQQGEVAAMELEAANDNEEIPEEEESGA